MVHKIKGMPAKAVEKMIKARGTPPHLKAYWEAQLKKYGSPEPEPELEPEAEAEPEW